MSKQIFQYSTIGAGVLSIMLLVPMLSGCGQDRPGIRYGADEPGGDTIQIHDPKNRDIRMAALMGLLGGEDLKKAKRAAINMGKLGHYAEPHLETMKGMSEHPDPEVREAINQAIKDIEADIAKQQAGGGEAE